MVLVGNPMDHTVNLLVIFLSSPTILQCWLSMVPYWLMMSRICEDGVQDPEKT